MRFGGKTIVSALVLAIALAMPQTGFAQSGSGAGNQSQNSEADTINIRTEDIPTIEVTGERPLTEAIIASGVRDIAKSRRTTEPVERFLDPLCVSVAGLGEAFSQRVADRIRANANEATLETGDVDCDVNALVIVVDNPEVLIDRMRDLQPRLFAPAASRMIRAAITLKDPAIAWNSVGIRGSRGGVLIANPGFPGGGAVFDNGNAVLNQTDAFRASRARIPYSVARLYSVVIFDVRQLVDMHLDQIADYATMQLLGSPRRTIDFEENGAHSILSLFKDGPWDAPTGMTQLDRAYLRGLYSMDPNEPGSRLIGSSKDAYTEIAAAECTDEETCQDEDG
jgi:hypothetical protein